MDRITLENRTVESRGKVFLQNISLQICPGETWVFLGANGSGKTMLGRLISGEAGDRSGFVSFEREKAVIDRERKEDQSDILDYPDPGRSASQFILERRENRALMENLAERFRFSSLLDRGLKYLSTGELRKVLIAEELMDNPEMLILDEPYDGLDVESRKDLSLLIDDLIGEGVQLVLLLNRLSEIPRTATKVGYLQKGELLFQGSRDDILNSDQVGKLLHFHQNPPETLPTPPEREESFYSGNTLVQMTKINVSYEGKAVLKNLDWTLKRGEHWKISGPNGVGKSTLLSLISGDNPQAYANDLTLFGMKRGSGETVWDIKKHIGYVSSSLHRDYRVRTSVLSVVISGYHDSIGVYGKYSEMEERRSMEWLKMVRMDHKAGTPFQSLSFGEQRLILIIRAMVKHPPLLILDEPCQGLDEMNREMILGLIDIIARISDTTILYVTHHDEDKIEAVKNIMKMKFRGEKIEIYSEEK